VQSIVSRLFGDELRQNDGDDLVRLAHIGNFTLFGNGANSGKGIAAVGGSKFTIVNSILWDDAQDEVLSESTDTTIVFCDVRGGWPGTGNIDEDPRFADPENGDFHLLYPSPCRDAGYTPAVQDEFDFEGDPRVAWGGKVDMGSDEFHQHLYYTGDPSPSQVIDLKVIGLPTYPVMLYAAASMLPRPHATIFGAWHLEPPYLALNLGIMPMTGLVELEQAIPPDCPVPLLLPMQAWVRNLTNLELLEID